MPGHYRPQDIPVPFWRVERGDYVTQQQAPRRGSDRMSTRRPDQLLIGGKLVPARGGATYPILNPATEEDRASPLTPRQPTWTTRSRRPAGVRRDVVDDMICARAVFASSATRCRRTVRSSRALTIAEVGCPAFMTSGAHFDGPVEGLVGSRSGSSPRWRPTSG